MSTVAEGVRRHRFPRIANQLQVPGAASDRALLLGAFI